VPAVYVGQLSLYRTLLAPLYPDRRVEAGLLFTETPQLMALPEAMLDDALARLVGA
jgi:ATP-dependent helicase/nuclease subunit A